MPLAQAFWQNKKLVCTIKKTVAMQIWLEWIAMFQNFEETSKSIKMVPTTGVRSLLIIADCKAITSHKNMEFMLSKYTAYLMIANGPQQDKTVMNPGSNSYLSFDGRGKKKFLLMTLKTELSVLPFFPSIVWNRYAQHSGAEYLTPHNLL